MLIERVEVSAGDKSGISIWRSARVTVRYVTAHDNPKTGISNGVCLASLIHDLDGNGEISLTECTEGFPPSGAGKFLIYSNDLHGNNMGVSINDSLGEIAGNLMVDSQYGGKFVDSASQLWIHHNLVAYNNLWGWKINNQHSATEPDAECNPPLFADETLAPNHHVFYRNSLLGNGGYGVQTDRATELFFVDNQYLGNCPSTPCQTDSFYLGGRPRPQAMVFSCPGDEATTLVIGMTQQHTVLDASDPRCDLSDVGSIF